MEAAPIINRLRPDEKRILNILRLEHIAYTMLAVIRAKELREMKKAQKVHEHKRQESIFNQNQNQEVNADE